MHKIIVWGLSYMKSKLVRKIFFVLKSQSVVKISDLPCVKKKMSATNTPIAEEVDRIALVPNAPKCEKKNGSRINELLKKKGLRPRKLDFSGEEWNEAENDGVGVEEKKEEKKEEKQEEKKEEKQEEKQKETYEKEIDELK